MAKRWNQLREVLWESHFVCLLQLLLYHIPIILKSHKLHSGLEIMAGQRTMSRLIVDLTGQTFVLPVMLTVQNSIVLKMK